MHMDYMPLYVKLDTHCRKIEDDRVLSEDRFFSVLVIIIN